MRDSFSGAVTRIFAVPAKPKNLQEANNILDVASRLARVASPRSCRCVGAATGNTYPSEH